MGKKNRDDKRKNKKKDVIKKKVREKKKKHKKVLLKTYQNFNLWKFLMVVRFRCPTYWPFFSLLYFARQEELRSVRPTRPDGDFRPRRGNVFYCGNECKTKLFDWFTATTLTSIANLSKGKAHSFLCYSEQKLITVIFFTFHNRLNTCCLFNAHSTSYKIFLSKIEWTQNKQITETSGKNISYRPRFREWE